jgi:hypothetical protein
MGWVRPAPYYVRGVALGIPPSRSDAVFAERAVREVDLMRTGARTDTFHAPDRPIHEREAMHMPVTVDALRELGRDLFRQLAEREEGDDSWDPNALHREAVRRMPEVFEDDSEEGGKTISTVLGQQLNEAEGERPVPGEVDAWVNTNTETWLVAAVELLHAKNLAIPGGSALLAATERPVEILDLNLAPGEVRAKTGWLRDPDSGRCTQLQVRSCGTEIEISIRDLGKTEWEPLGAIPSWLRSPLAQLLAKATSGARP